MKNVTKNILRFFKLFIGALIWIFGLGLLMSWSSFSVGFGGFIMVAYITISIFVWIYISQRAKLTDDKSFKAVINYTKNSIVTSTKQLITEIKQLFIGLFYLAIGIGIVGLIGWGLIGVGGWIFSSNDNDYTMQEHPNYANYQESKDCSDLEPENPYDYDSGHYAGFEWGENGNNCSGNSDSFVEGCEEYEIQDEAYTACLDNE